MLHFKPRRTEETAAYAFIRRRNRAERITLRDAMLFSFLANSPKQWDSMIKDGHSFSAVPVNPKAIREALGIDKNDRVVTVPVFSGEWSKVHSSTIGMDFSGEALRRHNNPFRIRADMRNLPLPDGYADHIISYEPTPLHPGTATILDALVTLYELARVGKNVHIIQRARNKVPIWTYPFVQQYLAALGVDYRIHDLSDHTIVTGKTSEAQRIGVVSLSFKGHDVMQHRETLEKDIRTAYTFLRSIAKRGEVTPHDVRILMRSASPALRKAFVEQFILRKKPRFVRRNNHL